MLNLSDPSLLRRQLYIDGNWVDADSGATMPVLNPVNKEKIVDIPNAGASETRRNGGLDTLRHDSLRGSSGFLFGSVLRRNGRWLRYDCDRYRQSLVWQRALLFGAPRERLS